MAPSPIVLKRARRRLEGSGSGAFAHCWRAPLAQLADDEEINDEDIVTEETSVTALKGLERVWKEILKAAADKMLERDQPSAIGFARALSLALEPIDEGVTKSGPDGKDVTPPGETTSTSGGKKESMKEAASGEEAADMLAQGATESGQLYQIAVGLSLGKKASRAESVGGGYGSSPSMSDGVKRAIKAKAHTLPALLEVAITTGDLVDLDRHLSRTMTRWMADPTDVIYMTAGSRLNQVWVKAKALRPSDGRVAAYFLHLFLDEYVGRGLPVLTDPELSQAARERFNVKPLGEKLPSGGMSMGGSDDSDGASIRSGGSVGSSASRASSAMTSQLEDLSKLFKESFEDLKESQVKMASRMERLENRTNDLKSQLGRERPAPSGDGTKQCHYCKSPDHLVADCPRLAEKEQREKDKAAGNLT